MKKIITLVSCLLALFLVVVSCSNKPNRHILAGKDGLYAVSKSGAIILEKTATRSAYNGYYNPIFILDMGRGDTLEWYFVPIEIYNKYNPKDTIKAL